MNKLFRNAMLFAALAGVLLLNSCKKDDPRLPDNEVNFQSDALGIGEDEESITITVNLSSAASVASNIIIELTSSDVVYGTHYTTTPVAVGNSVVIPVAAGQTAATFTLTKVDGAVFAGTESLSFAITFADNGLVIGDKKTMSLTFAEIIAESGTMELAGGGSTYPNKVFIDFSGNRQVAIDRTTWDLGFSTTSDFRVILNSSNGMMVRALDKNDLALVTAADTLGWGTQLSIAGVFGAITSDEPPEWVADAFNWIDDPSGDLTKTAIASVSENASENRVYIVNRGTGAGTPAPELGWKKIRVIRNGDGYTLQYADISATAISSIDIVKDNNFDFNYISFANGSVPVDPAKAKWDIAWTGFTNLTDFGTGPVPYYFQDIILQNTGGVEVALVLVATTSYEAFGESDLAGQTYGTSQVKIGSEWRNPGGPTTAPTIKTDRFYIIHDIDGNYYKVRFTALTTGGERGKPQLDFALVKKGS